MNAIVSVNVGLPRDGKWRGKTVRTAICKERVQGRVLAARLNLIGDGQADLSGHGGKQRAVTVYQLASYRYWESYLRRSHLVYGNFGRNFTVERLADDEVCIRHRFRTSNAINHRNLLRHANRATPRLIWRNFAHLFTVSLMPFSTAWVASTELPAIPVTVYASVFVLVNTTYITLCFEARRSAAKRGRAAPRANDDAHAIACHTRYILHRQPWLH